MSIRLTFLIVLLGAMVGLAACSGDPEVTTNGPDTGSAATNGVGAGNGTGAGTNVGGGGSIIDGNGGKGGGGGTTCKTKCDANACGPVADGCGKLLECGSCKAPQTCGGGGEPSKCGGTAACKPKTCAELGFTCGSQADGCGGQLDCWPKDAPVRDGKKGCADAGDGCVDGKCTALTSCTPKTCADYDGVTGICGPVSDGCGSTLDCAKTCASDEVCGAIEPGKCGKVTCSAISCEQALADKPAGFCGALPDGCGGLIPNCAATCSGGQTCGGAGVQDVCGTGTTTCTKKTIADCGATNCGSISDGCGGLVECGTCTDPQSCGGGGEPGKCGAPVCKPLSCADYGANCGTASDGCGGVTPVCGSCDSNEVCNANKCEPVVCVPKSQTEACNGVCGTQSNGCGGTYTCPGCTLPNTCGGGGTPSVCGAPACTKLTCAGVGANCGPIGDGCGGIIDSCGECTGAGEECGGITPSVCGVPVSQCTGLCQNQDKTCPADSKTRLSGKVYAPNGTEPLYNALVYVPNKPLPSITQGASCERCEDEDLGEPIASAITGPDGAFVLQNVPAGVSFPLVVKMGKWRRVVTIPAVTRCTNVDLAVDQARLPRNMTDSDVANRPYINIPRFAMVTGKVDEIECVLRKIGLSDSEFSLPSGSGRVHMYRANGAGYCTNINSAGTGCRNSGKQSVDDDDLFAGSTLDNYDISVFDCEGSANDHDANDPKLRAWAEKGGRIFASHFSYKYLDDNGTFADTATWGGTNGTASNTTGIVDTTSAKGQAFNSWLGNVAAHHPTYGDGYISVDDPRYYVKSAAAGSERFVYTDANATVGGTSINATSGVLQYAFNTPVGAASANVCGRVIYSAFHVANAGDNSGSYFPFHCSNSALTPQEKVLMFMLFDLSACVTNPPPAGCQPKDCAAQGANCGFVADGCGGIKKCGDCTAPDSCGGGGVSNVCGSSCTRTTCGAQGANCGVIADGCGGTLDCGSCTAPAICGGGGTANVCGTPQCTPRSCGSVGATCGALADGCGNVVNCGTCTGGQVCGGGGTPNVCGAGSCSPSTCTDQKAECGFVGDGCGGTVNCGTCTNGGVCGGAGPNLCGLGCTKRTCTQANATCGFIGDGCGGVVDCGTCTSPAVCGGAGVPSQCGGSCSPRTCNSAGAECGAISDGCGGVLECGVCAAGKVCGAGGTNKCGVGSCTPKDCTAAGAECGFVGDGCGETVDCGKCPAGQSCGGAGVPNKCGAGGCVPRTCTQQNANCGPVADGCGGLLDCGSCPGGQTCGGNGVPNQCAGIIK